MIQPLSTKLAETTVNEDGFHIHLDVRIFAPNEITVTTQNNCIVVKAEHAEDRCNIGHILRQFSYKSTPPQGYNISNAVSQLTNDGTLIISIPPGPNSLVEQTARILPIQLGPTRSIQ